MSVYVQFSDNKETEVIGQFAAPQPTEFFPYQGEIEESDPRYTAFVKTLQPANS